MAILGMSGSLLSQSGPIGANTKLRAFSAENKPSYLLGKSIGANTGLTVDFGGWQSHGGAAWANEGPTQDVGARKFRYVFPLEGHLWLTLC